MEPLRDDYKIKSTDLRKALGVAPATMSDIYKKVGYKAPSGTRRGSSRLVDPIWAKKILNLRGHDFPEPAKVISIMMCKGGVGKTTSSYFLGQRLSSYGAKVLLIDSDSQGNLTSVFDLDSYESTDFDDESFVLVDVIEGNADIDEVIWAITPNLHLIPSSPVNARLEGVIREKAKNPSKPISRILNKLKDKYNYIIIDCAPALNLTNTATICASNLVLLPVAPDKFSKFGVQQTLKEIETIENDFNLEVDKKIVFTRFDGREFTSMSYLSEIANEYESKMYSTMIRTSADCKNSITKKEDLFSYSKSNAKEDYDELTREIIGLKNNSKKK